MSKEKFKTRHDIFDKFTNRTVFRLISQKQIDGLIGIISSGKESQVFSALRGDEKVIVKIHRIDTRRFDGIYSYIKLDPRFSSVLKKKREVIFAWAKREFRNLLIAREAQVSAPKPYTSIKHVVVMEYIGKRRPAPMLKDKKPKKPREFLEKIIENMRKLYKKGFVHSDLSQFNILNYDERPVLIDFSQCTSLENTEAGNYLERDVRNIAKYFKKIGVDVNKKKIKKKVTS